MREQLCEIQLNHMWAFMCLCVSIKKYTERETIALVEGVGSLK